MQQLWNRHSAGCQFLHPMRISSKRPTATIAADRTANPSAAHDPVPCHCCPRPDEHPPADAACRRRSGEDVDRSFSGSVRHYHRCSAAPPDVGVGGSPERGQPPKFTAVFFLKITGWCLLANCISSISSSRFGWGFVRSGQRGRRLRLAGRRRPGATGPSHGNGRGVR